MELKSRRNKFYDMCIYIENNLQDVNVKLISAITEELWLYLQIWNGLYKLHSRRLVLPSGLEIWSSTL